MRRNTKDILEVLVNNSKENIDINIEKNKKQRKPLALSLCGLTARIFLN